VLVEQGQPLQVREITLAEPAAGQVRVRLVAAGVCHSDLSLANGTLKLALPAVLGHEGAGVVEAVGEGVTKVKPGDHVVLNWSPACRACWFCEHGEPYLCVHGDDASVRPHATLEDGSPVHPGLNTGAFAEATLVSEAGVVPIPANIPMDAAAVLGCAVLTGSGAVFRTANVQSGQSVLVIGLGGVGLSVLQAARIAGAETIIAVDTVEEKRELAIAHGATDFLVADDSTAKAVRGLTGGRGVDVAFECVGIPPTIRTAWSASRRGGTVVVVGVGSRKATVEFNALELYWFGRTLHGCVYGQSDPDRDLPELLSHVDSGALDVGALVTSTTDLDGINAAFEDMKAGRGARTLVRFGA